MTPGKMRDRQHVEEITGAEYSYEIEMGGAIDGENTRDVGGADAYHTGFEPNLWVRLENLGDAPVVKPWLLANDRDWRNAERIVAGILRPEMDDAEKAMAIWAFVRDCRFHATPHDADNRDPVKMLNVYGYCFCTDCAHILPDLWRVAGLEARAGHPISHNSAEVFYDGSWHSLDGDHAVFCLLRDNRTVAGETEMVRDHDLIKRTHNYGILRADNRVTDEIAAAYYLYEGERCTERPSHLGHRMQLTLRPGEALLWRWASQRKYHGQHDLERWPHAYERIANGLLTYCPDTASDLWRWGAARATGVAADGPLRLTEPGRGEVVFEIASPYVIVGGRLEMTVAGEQATLALSYDSEVWTELPPADDAIVLAAFFPPTGPARYGFFVRLTLENQTGGALTVEHLKIESDLQMAPLSLPGLRLGTNRMRYVDESEGPRRVRITHAWRESAGNAAPDPPSKPVFPRAGADVEGTQFTFEWAPVATATDYHFQLSARADLKYPLSPNFDKLTSNTPLAGEARYAIPYEGLLNPGETYYWRVRARNDAGVWGTWGPTWQFQPQGPGLPAAVRTEGCARLTWEPDRSGRPPARYLVYGSNERGFTASDEPYPVKTGNGEPETVPANLLATVEGAASWVIADEPRAFYRVVAVDANGVRSGPSDYAEMPRPFIYSRPPATAAVGSEIRYQVKSVRSSGDLRLVKKAVDGANYDGAITDLPTMYAAAGGARRSDLAFRNADRLQFELAQAPPWLSLDPASGLATGTPPEPGAWDVAVKVVRQQGGEDVQAFVLTVN